MVFTTSILTFFSSFGDKCESFVINIFGKVRVGLCEASHTNYLTFRPDFL